MSNVFNEIEIGENKVLEKSSILKMLEPILLNPNSYKNIHHILKQLKIFAEWVLIDFDRPPYCLASGILKSSPDEFDFSTLVAGLGDFAYESNENNAQYCRGYFTGTVEQRSFEF